MVCTNAAGDRRMCVLCLHQAVLDEPLDCFHQAGFSLAWQVCFIRQVSLSGSAE